MFIPVLIHHQQDYWQLYNKITVDYAKKHIIVNNGVTSLDVQIDLYSDLKEIWQLDDRKYRNFRPPVRVIGGDPTTGGQFAGDIYFMTEGWKLFIDLTETQLAGALFSDDYATPLYDKATGEPVYSHLVSSLVTAVQPSLEGLSIPTSEQNASAVMASVVESGFTLNEIMRILTAAMAGKLSGATDGEGPDTIVIRDINDTVDRITSDVDKNGNRLAVTTNVD